MHIHEKRSEYYRDAMKNICGNADIIFEKTYKDHIYFDSAKKAIDYMKHFVKYHRFNNFTLTLNVRYD